MSANSSSQPQPASSPAAEKKRSYNWWLLVALPAWVFVGFMFAQALLYGAITGLRMAGVQFDGINNTILQTTVAAFIYLLSAVIVIGLPWIIKKRRTDLKTLGTHRLPSWMDIGLAPAGFIVYLLASGVIMYLTTKIFSGFDPSEQQQIGFDNLNLQYEYLLAFVTLVVVAPIAEEVLFRGYLYGKLRRAVPIWLAMVATSIVFGLLHTQWTGDAISGINVGIDVFALSIIMCSLREVTGSIWAGVLVHMLKNGLAFYLLFINTSLLSTIGG